MAIEKKQHVFIVDDDPSAVQLLTTLLESADYRVSSNTNSQEAFKEILSIIPDCIIIDFMMPDTNGLELCESLRKESKLNQTKIIFVSAKAYATDVRHAYSSGADGYITKPIDPERFIQQVKSTLYNRLEIKFWGVHGTLPISGDDTSKYGGRTSCVSVNLPKGQLIIFDAGTGIRRLSDYLVAKKSKNIDGYIFITHPHWDHINALPYFMPLYASGNSFSIYGAPQENKSIKEQVAAQMDGTFFPVRLEEFGAGIKFQDITDCKLQVGDATIHTIFLNHPGQCLGYKLEYSGKIFCYITDNELYPKTHERHDPFYEKLLTEFVKEADILIMDATYSDEAYKDKIGWGHSQVSDVVHFAHHAQVKKLCLFHHDIADTDKKIDEKLEHAQKILKAHQSKTVCLAPYEGETIYL